MSDDRPLHILVLDDYEDRAAETKESIEQGVEAAGLPHSVVTKTGEDFTQLITNSFEIFASMRDGKVPAELPDALKEADIVFVDYALDGLNIQGVIHTADTIIGYLRSLTSNTYFVSLNRNEDVDFDLRFLIGDFDSKADVALNNRHLAGQASLWSEGIQTGEFRPWYWPVLSRAQTRRSMAINTISGEMEAKVLEVIGFQEVDISALSRHARGFLDSSVAKEIPQPELAGITFRELFKSTGRSLGHAHRERFFDAFTTGKFDENGSARDVDPEARELIRRLMTQIVAHEIDIWMRRDVIGGQDVLVDVPHLIERYPFLLGDSVKDLATWQQMAADPPTALSRLEEVCPYWDVLRDHLMGDWEFWSDRPIFWWKRVEADETLTKALYRFDWTETPHEDPVFCEDTSRFEPRASATKFNIETETSYPVRFIRKMNTFQYTPTSRLFR